jgi:hypothetical protein
MDDNTRQVLIAVVGVVGTLGGIGLGWVLQGLRRHDEARRESYSRFISLATQTIERVEKLIERLTTDPEFDQEAFLTENQGLSDNFNQAYAEVLVLGSPKAAQAAVSVADAMVSEHGSASTPAEFLQGVKSNTQSALEAFVHVARKDLGQRATPLDFRI